MFLNLDQHGLFGLLPGTGAHTVLDMAGRDLLNGTLSGENPLTLDLSSLDPGPMSRRKS